jgi:hypothetical protein
MNINTDTLTSRTLTNDQDRLTHQTTLKVLVKRKYHHSRGLSGYDADSERTPPSDKNAIKIHTSTMIDSMAIDSEDVITILPNNSNSNTMEFEEQLVTFAI